MSKYRWAFIVYMFRWPSAVFNWVSDNILISGFGKAHIIEKNKILKFFWSCNVFFRLDWYLDSWVMRQQCGAHKFCVLLLNLQTSARFTCCPWMQNPHPLPYTPLPVGGSLKVAKLGEIDVLLFTCGASVSRNASQMNLSNDCIMMMSRHVKALRITGQSPWIIPMTYCRTVVSPVR